MEAGMDHLNLKQTYEMVRQFFKKHWQRGKKHTVNHFVAMGLNEWRVYRITTRWEQSGPMDRNCGQGHKAIKMPPRKITQVIRLALHRPGISTTKLAQKFNITSPTLQNLSRRWVLSTENDQRHQSMKGPNCRGQRRHAVFYDQRHI